jgi:hypothetical protein
MEYRAKLLSMLDHVRRQEEQLLDSLAETTAEARGDYDHWTLPDILTHLAEWRLIAAGKLAALAEGKAVPFHEDLDAVNRRNYAKHCRDSAGEIRALAESSHAAFRQRVAAFDEGRLGQPAGLEGFDAPLWRYILIDGFLHPTLHRAVYHFAGRDFAAAFRILAWNYRLLAELDDSPAMARSFLDCEDLVEEVMEREELLRRLREFRSAGAGGPDVPAGMVEWFLEANRLG